MEDYGDDFESFSSEEDEGNAGDLSGASGYSSLSSPERQMHPLATIETMLAQMRDVRRDTLAAVEVRCLLRPLTCTAPTAHPPVDLAAALNGR